MAYFAKKCGPPKIWMLQMQAKDYFNWFISSVMWLRLEYWVYTFTHGGN